MVLFLQQGDLLCLLMHQSLQQHHPIPCCSVELAEIPQLLHPIVDFLGCQPHALSNTAASPFAHRMCERLRTSIFLRILFLDSIKVSRSHEYQYQHSEICAADSPVWLNPDVTDPQTLTPLLHPYTVRALDFYPVSKAVNSAQQDSSEFIRKINF
jgi:hypothetical protein